MPEFTQLVSDGAGFQLRTVRLHHLTLKYKNIVRLQVSTSQMTSYTDKYYCWAYCQGKCPLSLPETNKIWSFHKLETIHKLEKGPGTYQSPHSSSSRNRHVSLSTGYVTIIIGELNPLEWVVKTDHNAIKTC